MKLWIVLGGCLLTGNVFAEACMLESNPGEYPNKWCMENAGAPTNVFNNFCSGSADEANTVTNIASCPKNSIATCKLTLNGVNGKFVQHVYTVSLLKAYEMTCKNNVAGKGVWKLK